MVIYINVNSVLVFVAVEVSRSALSARCASAARGGSMLVHLVILSTAFAAANTGKHGMYTQIFHQNFQLVYNFNRSKNRNLNGKSNETVSLLVFF